MKPRKIKCICLSRARPRLFPSGLGSSNSRTHWVAAGDGSMHHGPPHAQQLVPFFCPPSSAVGATTIVSPPVGRMTSPEDSKDLDDTMR